MLLSSLKFSIHCTKLNSVERERVTLDVVIKT